MNQACNMKNFSIPIRQRNSFSKIHVLTVLSVLMWTSGTVPCLPPPSIQMRIVEDFIQNSCATEGQSEKHLENTMVAGYLQPL